MKPHHLLIVVLTLLASLQTINAETGVGDWMHFNGLLSSVAANDDGRWWSGAPTTGAQKLRVVNGGGHEGFSGEITDA